MTICGCDYSTKFIDLVLLDEDTDAATWHRFELAGQDAFDRARDVRQAMHDALYLFDDVLACGIEDPRGYNAGALYRIQGAILSRLPPHLLVQPFPPSVWRKTVGLPGNATKADIELFVDKKRFPVWPHPMVNTLPLWPQDACDAFCIALATRSLLHQEEAA